MGKVRDLLGQRFGRLVIVGRLPNDAYGQSRWLCRCDCGSEKELGARVLITGKTKSCGCLRRESVAISNAVQKRTHGMAGTRTYQAYHDAKRRCEDRERDPHQRYGSRCIEFRFQYQFVKQFACNFGCCDPPSLIVAQDFRGYFDIHYVLLVRNITHLRGKEQGAS